MLFYCPTCGNLLLLEDTGSGNRFYCNTCPYVYKVESKITTRYYPHLKELDEVIGGAAAWQNVDSTEAECPFCSHKKAYFMQLQTRSADEPMTTFYKCANQLCGHNWRD